MQSVTNVLFGSKYMRKMRGGIDMQLGKEGYFNNLSCNCGFSSSILCYSLSSDSFLKVKYNVECETIPVNFSYFVTLKPACWSGTWMDFSSTYDSVTSYMADLENSYSSSYADLLNVGTFCFIIEKTNSLILPSISLENSVIIEKPSRSRKHYISFQNSNFTWKFKFYLWQRRLSVVFLKVMGSVYSFKKKVCQTRLKDCSSWVSGSFKLKWRIMRQRLVLFAATTINNCTSAVPRDNPWATAKVSFSCCCTEY